MRRIRSVVRSSWAKRRRITCIALLLVATAFTTVHLIACVSTSPTDRIVTLEDGRELAYMRVGDERARRVILIHGAPTNAASWSRLIDTLDGESLDIVAIDRLGYGDSTPGAAASLDDHVASLKPLLTDGVILVGHSYGGPVALHAAAAYPDRVGGVILIAGACDPHMQDAVTFRKIVRGIDPILPADWAVANRELLALNDENEPIVERAADVRRPVTIIHGTWDPVCPHDDTIAFLESHLVNAKVRIVSLPRAGHNLHRSHTAVIKAELHDMVAALESHHAVE